MPDKRTNAFLYCFTLLTAQECHLSSQGIYIDKAERFDFAYPRQSKPDGKLPKRMIE